MTYEKALRELVGRLDGLMSKPHPLIRGEAARKIGFELRQAKAVLESKR